MSIAPIAGITAGILDFISFIPYIHSIRKGKTKPNRATFGIWAGVGVLLLASYFSSGARYTVWFVLSYVIMQFVVFFLSIKHGVGGLSKLDVTCIIGALTGALLWIVTKNPVTALYINLMIEAIGFMPTIKKSYLRPNTENTLSWLLCTVAAFINLFAITSFSLHIALYPFVILACDSVILALLLLPRKLTQTVYKNR